MAPPNRIIYIRDNLEVLRCLDTASVDLVYADPPFCSQKQYRAPIGSQAAGAHFADMWTLDDAEQVWLDEMQADDPQVWHVVNAAHLAHSNAMAGYLTYMWVRLKECHRILKDTGSLYLHCDDTADSYLRVLLDAVFGASGYRNAITWKRQNSNNASTKRCGRIADTLLFYSKKKATWNGGHHELSEVQLSRYRHTDSEGRRYKCDDLTAPDLSENPERREWRGTAPGPGRRWAYRMEKLEQLWAEGRIQTKRDGSPRLDGHIQYLDESAGQKLQSIWTDIPRVGNTAKERTGYPTQKPLALLRRIIKASTHAGDLVLDPFCGCATTCLAAEELGRRWIGIDGSAKADELVKQRFEKELKLFGLNIATTRQLPVRSDRPEAHFSKNIRTALFRAQAGCCNGCKRQLDADLLELDHIVPRAKGGENRDENAQLLCSTCNRIKGHRSNEYLIKRLRELNRR